MHRSTSPLPEQRQYDLPRASIGAEAAAAAAGWDWRALCAPVLAARALAAQAEAQLWVRNGDDLLTDVHYYSNAR